MKPTTKSYRYTDKELVKKLGLKGKPYSIARHFYPKPHTVVEVEVNE